MATCEWTACAASRPAAASYSAMPVSSHEVSIPRINMPDFDTIQPPSRPQRNKELDADRTSQGKRAVRGGHAPLQADRREDRPPYGAPFPRVLRKADRRA